MAKAKGIKLPHFKSRFLSIPLFSFARPARCSMNFAKRQEFRLNLISSWLED